jgi:large subunit ribosomal protein L17
MRHAKKFNHLGRTAPHRKAMLSNMASSLILHKRITTTVAKAKALRKYVEPLITKSKSDNTHSRRVVFSYLQDKDSTQVLFNEVAEKVADRPGGYTRIIKLGNRLGDNAEMALIELVDYNDTYQQEEQKKTRTRRSRRGGKKNKTATADSNEASETQSSSKAEETEVKDEVKTSEIDDEAKSEVEDKEQADSSVEDNDTDTEDKKDN